MPEIMKATVPVLVCLVNEQDQVYLQRRFQTGYLDGYYEPPAGKTDALEFPVDAACRELHEEAGITVNPDDLELFHCYMNLTDNRPWLGLVFRARSWQGEPTIKEPNKCDDAGFFDVAALPKVSPMVRDALARLLVAPAIDMSNYQDINRPLST